MTTKRINIPYSARNCQIEIENYEQMYPYLVAVCHRRFGKTVKGVIRLIKSALKAASYSDDHRGYYIAPNQKQAKRIVWHFFRRYLAGFGNMVTFNETELRIDFNISRYKPSIYLAGSENIENLRGVYIDDCVLDEMASWQNAEYAFYEVLFPAMSDRNGRSFIIGTVKGLDMFYELSQMGQDKIAYPEWHTLIYPVTETGVFSPEKIALLRRMMSLDAFEREYMCNFFAEVPDRLISPQAVMAATNRLVSESSVKASPEVWGYDVGFTNDPSKLARRRGPRLYQIETVANKDSDYQALWLKQKIDQHNPKYVYIDGGYGEGVISKLSNMGYAHIVVPVWFNGTSPKAGCFNMRAYMYHMAEQWLKHGSIPPGEKLRKQLSNVLLDDTDPQRRIKLQAKKKIKEVIRESPDESDAFALTFAGGGDEEYNIKEVIENADQFDDQTLMALVKNNMQKNKKYNPETHFDNMFDKDIYDLLDTQL
jgi:hypothetical protein